MIQERLGLIRDAVIAIVVACGLVGGLELMEWLGSIGTSDPDALTATGLVQPMPQRSNP